MGVRRREILRSSTWNSAAISGREWGRDSELPRPGQRRRWRDRHEGAVHGHEPLCFTGPGCPPSFRFSPGALDGGFGGFTMSLDGGFEEVKEFFKARASITRSSATSFSNAAIRSACHFTSADNCRSRSVCKSDSSKPNILGAASPIRTIYSIAAFPPTSSLTLVLKSLYHAVNGYPFSYMRDFEAQILDSSVVVGIDAARQAKREAEEARRTV